MKNFVLLVSLMMFLFSCCGIFSPLKVNESDNFPLEEKWKFVADRPVYAAAAQEKWVAVIDSKGVVFIDAVWGEVLWKRELSVNSDSNLHFTNNFLVVQNEKGLYVFDEFGNIKQEIEFQYTGDGPKLLGVYENLAFVFKANIYRMEVFDLNTGVQAWADFPRRGFMGLTYNTEKQILYFISLDYIRAYQIETGEILWNIDEWARAGVYADGQLYYCGKSEDGENLFLASYDVENLAAGWREFIGNEMRVSVYGLTVIDDILVASTDMGLYAVDTTTGTESWIFAEGGKFHTKPVMLDGKIYAKNMSNTIYAIRPETGHILGSLRLEKLPSMMPNYMYQIGLMTSDEQLIITTTDTVYSFGVKQ